jgi:hypothetical protein
MYRQIAVLFLCCLPLRSQKVTAPVDESDKQGVLEVLFVTSLGEPVAGEPRLTVENLVDGKPVAGLKVGRTMKLNYGTYRLKAHYPGSYPVDKIVKIQSPFQATSICFFISPIESPWDGNLIRGHISDKSKENDCRWIRFVSPFADGEVAETKATKGGDFALENVRPGKYLAFTIGKGGICEMAEVTIRLEVGKAVYDLVFPWAALQTGEARRSSPEAQQ